MESATTSLVNDTTFDLLRRLFSRDDYHSFAAQIADDSDAENMLDFILEVLRDLDGYWYFLDIDRRARRFMLKVIKKTPVLPESLNVTGIRIPAQHYIGRGGFGQVFKGELRGEVVALKLLYKTDNNFVSYFHQSQHVIS